MTLKDEVKFGREINKSKVECKCFNCEGMTVIRVDPDEFMFNLPYTCLCNRCLKLDRDRKQEDVLMHVVRMMIVANGGVL